MQINIEMTSSRPYLLRALNEWIIDNDLTPHIVVDATYENVVVPTQYVEADKIVLNIAPSAVSNFNITNEFISFSARFSGKAMEIFVPVASVMALYSKENGQGMVFNDERANPASVSSVDPSAAQVAPKKPVARPAVSRLGEVKKELKKEVKDEVLASPMKMKKNTSNGRPSLKLVD